MSVDPAVIRSEPHIEVGNLLQANVAVIIDRWTRRAIQEQPNAARVHQAVLVDHLHELLRKLGRSLAASDDSTNGEHCATATRHGEQRWETGWSVLEVVRDYQILRLVTVDFLEENLDRLLGHREALAVGLAFDEAISASIATYVRHRDLYLGELEKQRAEEDKQTRERLEEQAALLQDADRRKNEFLAVLAHELRNPIAPIRNATEFLRLQAAADPNVQWAREVITRQVQQLTHMVDDLLDVSRIARGKIRLEKKLVALRPIVDRAVETVDPIVQSNQHRLTVSLPGEAIWLYADAARLTQVFVNLLTNAVKHSDERCTISVRAERAGEEVVIRVRDTGFGIRPELLTRVFDPFTQDEQSSERSRGGLGIGLNLVRSLVDLHGGRVQAFSDGPGQGSEFVVHLPIATQKSPAVDQDSMPIASTAAGPPRAILVVDDNADAAESLAKLLRLLGHEVRTANDGEGALQAACAQPPDVVLLDIGLPGMDGCEVARRMHAEPGLNRTLLIAITGYGQEEDKRRSQEAGFDAHLIKPVDINALTTLLGEYEKPG
jgi:two-component system CheB/CheR fusion protein